jgi:ABC-2 type transport system ATP-binding protein
MGTGSTLELTVDGVPDDLTLDGIEAVSDVMAGGDVIRVTVSDPSAKSEIINRVEAQGATVTDISTEQASLEDLFAAYTTEGVTA